MQYSKKDIEIGRKFFSANSSYLTSSTNEKNLPEHQLCEVAFAGRSNVGKSSLINALTNRKKLARSSKTPGGTRQLNFFEINNQLILVDLPGYGYAKVSKKNIFEWTKLTGYYFLERSNLRTVFLLLDSRREIFLQDKSMMDFLDKIGLSWVVVLTKSDKLNNKILQKKKTQVMNILAKRSAAYPFIFSTSSIKSFGLEDLRTYISSFASKQNVL